MSQVHTPTSQKKSTGKDSPVPAYEIVLSEDENYPAISWPKDDHHVETTCNGDGNVYVWKLGLFGVTPNGVVSFSYDKLTDIPHAGVTFVAADLAVSDAGVYYRASGYTDEDIDKRTRVVTDSQGIEHVEQTHEIVHREQYITRFDKDGHYDGAIGDLPFLVARLAVFNSGTLIVQGKDDSGRPRIALLDSNGQLLRYLELPKDISSRLGPPPSGIFKPCYDCQKLDLDSVIGFSEFTPWQQDVLFYRGRGNIVYDVSEGGRVRTVAVKAPHGYHLVRIMAMDRNWLVDFYSPGSPDHPLLFEVDPQTGSLLREYRLKDADSTTLSCFGGGEFWGLRRDVKEGKLKVVRGSAQVP